MSTSKQVNGMANGQSSTIQDQRPVPPMGMTSQDFEVRAEEVIKDISSYYNTLQDRPVLPSIEPGYLQKLVPSSPPEDGEPWSNIRSDIESKIMPGITHWQSQKYMAFFPANSTYPSILAEMWSAALTSANFNWICSPAVTELENIVMDWMAQALHLPSGFMSQGKGGGVIQGSASEAVATTMIAARERYLKTLTANENFSSESDREDREFTLRGKMVALASAETHSSAHKAAMITGVRYRSIPTSAKDNFSLRAPAVRSTLEKLTAQGLHPFHLTLTLGTTNTCAIDDFAAIAALKADYPNLWIHVDAAYAGAALVLPEYTHLTEHFSAFDSFDMNMHKWLLVNFDCSCLFVQNRRDLTDALSVTPAYLRNSYTDSGLVTDYRDWQIPLGRRFRALKVWFVVRTYGLKGMREHIRHHLKLGDLFAGLVRERADLFEILTPPAFALTVVTVKPRGGALRVEGQGGDPRPYEESDKIVKIEQDNEKLKEANEVTKEVYQVIDGEKEIFLTASVIGGVYAIRFVSSNPLAEEKYVRRSFDILVDATERVLAKRSKA
ncbi:L-aspartate decarboxylase-like protein [Elsinoe australis]|uniref:L-aspartate decarboxylase-like protein n=1 Tax=Elsinoe australis TaxID=40998 RepID=A0A4U7AS64_9PEZI|nr:L-aspartate decarboxylase-like protein [Elsinoe australis]